MLEYALNYLKKQYSNLKMHIFKGIQVVLKKKRTKVKIGLVKFTWVQVHGHSKV